MKKCSTSLTIKEIQIKMTVRVHLPHQNGYHQEHKQQQILVWQGCGETGTLIHRWWKCKLVQSLWKAMWRLLKKLKIELPYDPAIPLLGMYLKECEPGYNRATCTPLFIAVLFRIAKLWNNSDPHN
jgi:hypothetical protein